MMKKLISTVLLAAALFTGAAMTPTAAHAARFGVGVTVGAPVYPAYPYGYPYYGYPYYYGGYYGPAWGINAGWGWGHGGYRHGGGYRGGYRGGGHRR